MNTKNITIAGILGVSALAFGVAYAQGPGCESGGMPGMKRSAMQQGGMMDPGARVEQRLSRLKGELKLTAQQEPLWQAFAEKSKAETDKGIQAMRERVQDAKQISAPERMAQMQSAMKQRLGAMESVNESFTRLYSSLTPEQKAAADKHFSAGGRYRHGPGRGGPQGAPGGAEQRKG
jgi:periplasmic protein CpxP/Spy